MSTKPVAPLVLNPSDALYSALALIFGLAEGSGSNTHETISGDTQSAFNGAWATDDAGNPCLQFSNTAGLQFTAPVFAPGTAAWEAVIRFKAQTSGSLLGSIFAMGAMQVNGNGVSLADDGTHSGPLNVSNFNNVVDTYPAGYADGNWHTAFVSVNGSGTTSLYIDNASTPVASASQTISINSISSGVAWELIIGGGKTDVWGNYSADFSGYIDFVYVANRQLTSSERTRLLTNPYQIYQVAPSFASAAVPSNGNSVAVTLTTSNAPLLPSTGVTGFTVKRNGVTQTVTSATASGDVVTLSLADTIYSTDTVTVEYAPGNVTDSAANALASFAAQAVTNNSTQTATDPTETSCSVGADGVTWTLTLTTDEPPLSGTTGFSGTINGVAVALSIDSVSGSTITLTAARGAVAGDLCKISYTPGDVADAKGNELMAFSNASVTNGSEIEPAVAIHIPSTGTVNWYPTTAVQNAVTLSGSSQLAAIRTHNAGGSVTGTAANLVDGNAGTSASINAHTSSSPSSSNDWFEIDTGAPFGVLAAILNIASGTGMTVNVWSADTTGLAPGAAGTSLFGSFTAAGSATVTVDAPASPTAVNGRYLLIEAVDASSASLTLNEVTVSVYPAIPFVTAQEFEIDTKYTREDLYGPMSISRMPIDFFDSEGSLSFKLKHAEYDPNALSLMTTAVLSDVEQGDVERIQAVLKSGAVPLSSLRMAMDYRTQTTAGKWVDFVVGACCPKSHTFSTTLKSFAMTELEVEGYPDSVGNVLRVLVDN